MHFIVRRHLRIQLRDGSFPQPRRQAKSGRVKGGRLPGHPKNPEPDRNALLHEALLVLGDIVRLKTGRVQIPRDIHTAEAAKRKIDPRILEEGFVVRFEPDFAFRA